MIIGQSVRVLSPFDEAFPGTYWVAQVEDLEGGSAIHLEGVESAFSPDFLEVVQ